MIGLGGLSAALGQRPLPHDHGLRRERHHVQHARRLDLWHRGARPDDQPDRQAPYTTVPRVVALIGGNGSVDTTTALTGVFNTNNPRSAATVDGSLVLCVRPGRQQDRPDAGRVLRAQRARPRRPRSTPARTRASSTGYNGTLYVSRDYNPPGSGVAELHQRQQPRRAGRQAADLVDRARRHPHRSAGHAALQRRKQRLDRSDRRHWPTASTTAASAASSISARSNISSPVRRRFTSPTAASRRTATPTRRPWAKAGCRNGR